MAEKIEGATQTCKCGTKLVCVKIISEWNNKKEEKLQWQNETDGKAHFKFIGGKPDCFNIISETETPEESATLQTKETEKEIGEVYSETRTKIQASIKTILKIRKQVIETVNEFENNPHPGMVWEMTALIYSQYYGDKK